MKCASAVSDHDSLERAIGECVSSVRENLGPNNADLSVVFVSGHFSGQYERIPGLLRDALGPTLLFGCSAGGVIGGGKEVEHRPGFSLTVAHLPDVELTTFHLEGEDLPDLDAGPEAWQQALQVPDDEDPRFLLLADPFSFPAQNFLLGMDYAFSRSVKIGGMASAGQKQGDNALFLGEKVYRSGTIGVSMRGNIAVDTVVAQGCRPIGPLMTITKSQQNLLAELDSRPPLEVLRECFSSASERDRELMQHSLFLGIVMDDLVEIPQHGDFLIRNIIGLDARAGVMAIGEALREGQRVQFHLRDALTSAEDLSNLLTKYSDESRPSRAGGSPPVLLPWAWRVSIRPTRPRHRPFRGQGGYHPLGRVLL